MDWFISLYVALIALSVVSILLIFHIANEINADYEDAIKKLTGFC